MDQFLIILAQALNIYGYALLIYVLMSWFPQIRETGFGRFFASICEPYLEPFRRFIPPLGMFDISVIVAYFVLKLASHGVYSLIGMM